MSSSMERFMAAVDELSRSSSVSERIPALSRLATSFVSCVSSSTASEASQATSLCISATLAALESSADASARLAADETLALVVRVALNTSAANRVHAELCRSMREANVGNKKLVICLAKFVMSCEAIKVAKRKAFVHHLVALLSGKLASISDEHLVSSLSHCLPRLMHCLGSHFRPEERMQLVNAYLPLLERDNVAVRRHGVEIVLAFVTNDETSRQQVAHILIQRLCKDIELDFTLGILSATRLLLATNSFSTCQLNFLYRSALMTVLRGTIHQSLIMAALELLLEMLRQASRSLQLLLTRAKKWSDGEAVESQNRFFNTQEDRVTNIGKVDDEDIPLIFCARAILLKFLLTSEKGKFSDARISCKILALDILVHILRLVPKIYLLPLQVHKDEEEIDEDQVPAIRDIILGYVDNSDPQIRALLIALQATVVKGAFTESVEPRLWFNQRRPDQNDLLQSIEKVQDDSYIVQRSLFATLTDLIDVCVFRHRALMQRITRLFLKFERQTCYWLVKLEMCNFIGKLPLNALQYKKTSRELKCGSKEVLQVLMSLISDDDPRVRSKAAQTLIEVVKKDENDTHTSWALIQAEMETRTTLKPLLCYSKSKKDFPESLMRTVSESLFANIFSKCSRVQSGSLETLALLSQHFPCQLHNRGWSISQDLRQSSAMHNLMSLMEALMTAQALPSDLSLHTNFIVVATNLSRGLLLHRQKIHDLNSSGPNSKIDAEGSSGIEDLRLAIKTLFSHCTEMLRLIALVTKECMKNLDTTVASLSSLTNPSSSSNLLKVSQSSFYVSEPKSSTTSLSSLNSNMADFLSDLDHNQNSSHLETLLTAYQLYLRSADNKHQKRLELLVEGCLQCVSTLLEHSFTTLLNQSECQSLLDCLETILRHINHQHSGVIQCMQALLSAIFGTNVATTNTLDDTLASEVRQKLSVRSRLKKDSFFKGSNNFTKSLFNICFEEPSMLFSEVLASNNLTSDAARPKTLSTSNHDKATLASYIRLFENLVIRCLKHYTATSKSEEQIDVLNLLVQLVQLRVNYCLLDSDQIFLAFLMRQLDELNRGKRSPDELSPQLVRQIFRLLLVLSKEKKKKSDNSSKETQKDEYVVSMSQIMEQLESLLVLTPYSSLALNEVSQSLFDSERLDDKKLDLPRDQCIKMALKLIRTNKESAVKGEDKALPLQLSTLSSMLSSLKGKSEERWRKMSLAVLDELLPALIYRHVSLNTLEDFLALRSTMHSISPSCLRPVDALLESFFASRFDPSDEDELQQWLALINVILPLVSTVSPEEGLLRQEQLNSELKLVKFILQAIFFAMTKLRELCQVVTADKSSLLFIRQNVVYLMLFVTHLVQSTRFPRITEAFVSLLDAQEGNDINALIIDLVQLQPFACAYWLRFLTTLNYCPLHLYQRLMNAISNDEEDDNNCLMHRSLLVLMCEYLCDTRAEDVESISWLLANFTCSLITLSSEEASVLELFQVLNESSSSSSGLLLQAIMTNKALLSTFSLQQLLKSGIMEDVHLRHSGQLLLFLIGLMADGRSVVVGKLASQVACARIEAIVAYCDDDTADDRPALEWVSSNEMGLLLSLLQRDFMQRRFPTFVALINCLVEQCFSTYQDLSPIIMSDEPQRVFGPWSVNQVHPDRKWFVDHVRKRCCRFKQPQRRLGENRMCAQLLKKIDTEEDLVAIVNNKDFNTQILKHLLKPNVNLNDQEDSKEEHEENVSKETLVVRVAKSALYSNMSGLVSQLPEPFELFHPLELSETLSESRYSLRLESLLQSKTIRSKLFTLMKAHQAFSRYCVDRLKEAQNVATNVESVELDTRFLIFGLEVVKWIALVENVDEGEDDEANEDCLSLRLLAQNCLATFAWALKCKAPFFLNCLEENPLMAVSAVLCLHSFVSQYQKLPSSLPLPQGFEQEASRTAEMAACIKLNELFTHFLNHDSNNDAKIITLSLCRLSLFHSFVRLPPVLWKTFVPSDQKSTLFTMPDVETLLDVDTLAQFIQRANVLGWRSRQQFEELWVTLLSVLSISKESLNQQDKRALNQCWTLVIQAMTSLLLTKTLVLPWPGQSELACSVVHEARDRPAPFLVEARRGRQLNAVQLFFHRNFEKRGMIAFLPVDATVNIERTPLSTPRTFQIGQVSIGYVQKAFAYKEAQQPSTNSSLVSLSFLMREEALNQMQLDLFSCTQFLFELFAQWLERLEEEDRFTLSHLELITETVRSMVLLSDFFMDQNQFAIMRDLFHRLLCLSPNTVAAEYVEDDVLQPWLVLGLCKSLGIIGIENSVDNDQNSLIESTLKAVEVALLSSGRAHSRRMAMYALLYLLQASNNELVDKALGLSLSSTNLELRQTSLQTSLLVCSVSHLKLSWSLAFKVLEHSSEHTTWLMPLALITASHASTPPGLYVVVMSGLQRLVVRRPLLMKPYRLRLSKMCTDLMSENHTWIGVPALQLFLAIMYVGDDEHREQEEIRDPERLMQAMEQMSILLDCVRRSDRCISQMMCELLPSSLRHFLPPSDLINRVVSEFLSPGQPHSSLMADVLFAVFHSVPDTQMLKEWLLMALPNLARRPKKQAVWAISCFLLAALKDRPWLQNVFPQLLLGDESNRKLFCLAANEFYESLNSDAMRRKFVQAIEDAAQDGPQDPFKEILIAINPCLPND